MSELIFPSEIEIPAGINSENPIAIKLVANGVGIFLTTDNLTTITNIVDGSVGIATDITNNEVGELSNDYRIGVNTTTLNAEEIDLLVTNPYQLFKRKSTVSQEYGLNLLTATQQISFPLVGAWTGTLIYSDGTTSAEIGTDAFLLDGTVAKFITSFKATDTLKSYYWEFNQTHGEQVKCHYTGAIATLVGFSADSGYVRGYGVSDGLTFDGTINVYSDFPSITVLDNSTVNIKFTPHELASTGGTFLSDGTVNTVFIINSSTSVLVKINGVSNTLTLLSALVVDEYLDWYIVRAGVTIDLQDAQGNSLVTSLATNGVDYNLSRVAGHAVGNPTQFGHITVKSLMINNTAFYDFTKITSNTTVPETINGNDGTLVGFTDVFVPEANKTLVGQEFSTALDQVTFTLSGAWTGNLIDTTGAIIAISGTGDYTLSGTTIIQVSNIDITDTVTTYNYDFSIESGNTITDTSGNGNHGSVVGGSLRRIYDYSGYGEIVGYTTEDNSFATIDTTNWQPNKVRYKVYLTATENMAGTFCSPYAYNSVSRGFAIRHDSVVLNVSSNNSTNVYFNFPSNLVDGTSYEVTIEAEDDVGIYRVFLDGIQLGVDYQSAWVGVRPKLNITRFFGYTHFSAPKGTYLTSRVILEDMESTLPTIDLDFAAGDSGKIVDTVGNNHAIITNTSTDKWQPIVPVDVFTVGTGKDYTLWYDFQLARKTQPNLQKSIIYGVTGDSATSYVGNGNFADGCIVEAASGYEWDIHNTNAIQSEVPATINCYDSPIYFKNIKGIFTSSVSKATAENCYITIKADISSFKKCIIDSDLVLNQTVDYSIVDSIILRRIVQNGGQSLLIQNCISNHNGNHLLENVYGFPTIISNSRFVYNQTLVGNMDGGGNVFGQDFTGAFVDGANNDYRINQAWADANLVGKGWNGSDIASSFYYTAISGGTIELAFTDVDVTSAVNDLILTRSTSIDLQSVAIGSEVGLLTLSRITGLSLEDIELSLSVDNLTLSGGLQLAFEDVELGMQVDTLSLTRIVNLLLGDISLSTNVDSFDITRTTNLTMQEINLALQVDGLMVSRVTDISLSDIELAMKVNDLILATDLVLTFEDISLGTKVDQIAVSRVTSLSFETIDISCLVDSISVERYTSLSMNDVVIPLNVNTLSLFTNAMPTITDGSPQLSGGSGYKLYSTPTTYKVN